MCPRRLGGGIQQDRGARPVGAGTLHDRRPAVTQPEIGCAEGVGAEREQQETRDGAERHRLYESAVRCPHRHDLAVVVAPAEI
jgi:hypothetical protein